MLKVIAEEFIKKEHIEKVLPLYKELVEKTRLEEGCIDYRLFIDEDDEGHFLFIEEWENHQALNRHCASEHFTRIVPLVAQYYSKDEKATLMKEIIY